MPTKKVTTKKHIVYHRDGSVWAQGSLVRGAPTGYWEWFRKPVHPGGGGTIMRSGYFEKGKQTGEWTTYSKEGKIVKVTTFK